MLVDSSMPMARSLLRCACAVLTLCSVWEASAQNVPPVAASSARGVTQALRDAKLSMTVAGRIEGMLVREGSRVRQGQLLMHLDRLELRTPKQADPALRARSAATPHQHHPITRSHQQAIGPVLARVGPRPMPAAAPAAPANFDQRPGGSAPKMTALIPHRRAIDPKHRPRPRSPRGELPAWALRSCSYSSVQQPTGDSRANRAVGILKLCNQFNQAARGVGDG